MNTPRRSDVSGQATAEAKPPRRSRPRQSSTVAATRTARPEVLVAPGPDDEAFGRRLSEWTDRLSPDGPIEQYLVERAVRVSWQIDSADRCQAAMLSAAAEPAGERPARPLLTADSPAGTVGDLHNYQVGLGRMLLGTLDTLDRLRGSSRPRREKPARPRSRTSKLANGPLTTRRAKGPSIRDAGVPWPTSALSKTGPVEPDRSPAGSAAFARGDDPWPADPAPAARAAGPLARRSSYFLRKVGRADQAATGPHPTSSPDRKASSPLQTGSGAAGDAAHSRNRGNEPIATRRAADSSPQNGANEPITRRRVGGYHVPIDSWTPGTPADRTPVRFRSRGQCTNSSQLAGKPS